MRQKMPTITESAAELRQRLKPAKDAKPRQRLQALYVSDGHAQQRQTLRPWWACTALVWPPGSMPMPLGA